MFGPQSVGGFANCVKGVAATTEKRHDVIVSQRPARRRVGDDRVELSMRECSERFGGRLAEGPRYPSIDASEACSVCRPSHGRSQRRIEPPIRRANIRRIDRKTLDEDLAGLGSLARQRLKVWPRPLGVDVIGRHRRNAAPIVDPAAISCRSAPGERFGGA